jgi:hypothetical protein
MSIIKIKSKNTEREKGTFTVKEIRIRAGRVAQTVECLPSKHQALSSNSSTTYSAQKKEIRTRIAKFLRKAVCNLEFCN